MKDEESIVYFLGRAGGRVEFGRLRLWLFISQPPQRPKLLAAEGINRRVPRCRLAT